MAKRKLDDAIGKYVQAIGFIKRLRESAPSNQIIAEALDKMEKELNEALFQLLNQKMTTGKQELLAVEEIGGDENDYG